MKYKVCEDGSYFCNNLIERRKGEPAEHLIQIDEKSCSIHLNGYAIIPLEKYYELTMDKPETGTITKNIEEVNSFIYSD